MTDEKQTLKQQERNKLSHARDFQYDYLQISHYKL